MTIKNQEPKIALFIDYDNIAIGLKELGGQKFEISLIMERLLEKGRIIFKRAYADWYMFSQGKQPLHDAGIEMIDIPMRRHIGKNSADIRLVVDALDLCYTKDHIDTFVIGSGDSDFSPLVSKLKENNKLVIGFGLRSSTSNLLADNCDEFIYYEDLVSIPYSRPPLPSGLSIKQRDAFTLVLDSIAALMREDKEVMWGSLIKDTIRRKKPDFSESQYGYNSFSQLLEDSAKYGLIGLIKDPKSGGTPVVTGFGKFSGDVLQTNRLSRPIAGTYKASPSLQVEDKNLKAESEQKSQLNRKPTVVKPRIPSRKKFSLKRPLAVNETSTAKAKNTQDIKESATKPKYVKKINLSATPPKPPKETTEPAKKTTAEKPAQDVATDKQVQDEKLKKPNSLPGRRKRLVRSTSSNKSHSSLRGRRGKRELASGENSKSEENNKAVTLVPRENRSIADLPVNRLEKISSFNTSEEEQPNTENEARKDLDANVNSSPEETNGEDSQQTSRIRPLKRIRKR